MEPIRDRAGESGRAQPDAESVRAILGSDSVRELVRRLPNALRGTIRCVAYGIQIVDDSPDRVRIVSLLQDEKPPDAEIDAGSNEVREFVEKGYATEESPFSIVLKTGQPVYFADLTTESGFPSILEIWRRSGVRSLLYLPLHFNGTFFGAFFCGSRKTDAFPEATRDLLSMVAELIALSVQNSLSQERTNRSRKALADERDRLQTLLQIAKVASSAMDTGSLVRAIFHELRKYFDHQFGSIIRYYPEAGNFDLLYVDLPHDHPGSAVETRVPMEETTSGEAFRMQRTVCYVKKNDAGQTYPWTDQVLERYGFKWVCSLPLTTAGRGRLGVLNLGGLEPDGPSNEQLEFLGQLAPHVALSLDRTFMLDELRVLNQQLARENLVLQEEVHGEHQFEEIVGRSAALANVLRQAELVAATDATVLVLGESGTGKELIARAIHRLSRRSTKPFVKINCAAIPSGLLESELFGHEKGAFTGAISQKPGRFELATDGTLFLDEVGEIPLELQPKLLRVLQEMEFERLGSTKTIKADVRVVAATNRDLKEMVRLGTFREDLYYRLHVFPLTLPSLRERREDIPLLVRYLVQRYSRKLGRSVTRIPEQAMQAMQTYDWPGNVRELENFVERAIILSTGSTLRPPLMELGVPGRGPGESGALTMEEGERRLILDALEACGWVIGGKRGAAARLAMKRTTLQSRMQKLGIRRPAAL